MPQKIGQEFRFSSLKQEERKPSITRLLPICAAYTCIIHKQRVVNSWFVEYDKDKKINILTEVACSSSV